MKKLLVTTLVAASAFAVSACHSDGTGNTYFYDRDGKGNIRISDKEIGLVLYKTLLATFTIHYHGTR